MAEENVDNIAIELVLLNTKTTVGRKVIPLHQKKSSTFLKKVNNETHSSYNVSSYTKIQLKKLLCYKYN